MSTVAIEITEPGGSPVDYTNSCIYERCSFTQQMNAVPGSFEVYVRDPEVVLSFTTGSEISLTIDGIKMFGGYIRTVSMSNLAPAADTTDPDAAGLPVWILRGTDYNIIFDSRVWRNTGNYLRLIDLSAFTTDGAILRELVDNFADLSDFDSSGIEDVATITGGDLVEQGKKLREEFKSLAAFGGTVWYANGDKKFIYTPFEDVEKRWGFSDDPNHNTITASPVSYQGATTGYRQVEYTEDGSYMGNDAFVWGGNKFSAGTLFARETDATSISEHGRWQVAEVHFGERLYSIQDKVDAVASAIVNGPPGADAFGQQKGLKYPQFSFQFTWFGDDVPLLSGVPDHLIPGDLVTIDMTVFGVNQLLPLRTLRTSFPNAFVEDGTHKVQFEGTFSLQLSDPYSLWAFLLSNRPGSKTTGAVVTAVDDTSTVTVFGARYEGTPTPTPDGATTVFTIPFGYIAGTTEVWYNGVFQRRDTDYTESDPEAGEITLTFVPPAPATGAPSALIVACATLDS